MSRAWRNGPLLLALCMSFWAGSLVSGRAAAPFVPPSLFTLLRWGGALLIMLPLAAPHLRRDWPGLRRRWWAVALLGFLGVVAYNNLVYRGLHDTTAVNALLLQSATPLVVLLAGLVLFNERPGWRQVAAILVSLAGVAVIAAQGSLSVLLALRLNPGDGLIMLGVAAYATYSALLRLRPAVHPFSLLAASFLFGVLILLPLAWVEYRDGARLNPTPLALSAIAYSCVFPSVLAYLFFNRGVELVGAARAGQYNHLIPAFGILLAVLFLGESLHVYHAAGMALIAAGLVLASVRPRPSPAG